MKSIQKTIIPEGWNPNPTDQQFNNWQYGITKEINIMGGYIKPAKSKKSWFLNKMREV